MHNRYKQEKKAKQNAEARVEELISRLLGTVHDKDNGTAQES